MRNFYRIAIFFTLFISYGHSYGFVSDFGTGFNLDSLNKKSGLNKPKILTYAQLENVIDKKNEYLRICEDSKLLLQAPKHVSKEIVFWECPDGQKIYSETLLIDQVSNRNSGLYKLRIISENDDFEGEVMVEIIGKKSNSFQKLSFCEDEKIVINSSVLGQLSNITWLNSDQKEISNSNSLELLNHPAGEFTYYIKTIKNGCETISNVPILVAKKPQYFIHIKEYPIGKVQLQIIGDIQNANYEWEGGLGLNENKSSLLIDKPRKGMHEYTCKIKQASCEVIAKSSFEISE